MFAMKSDKLCDLHSCMSRFFVLNSWYWRMLFLIIVAIFPNLATPDELDLNFHNLLPACFTHSLARKGNFDPSASQREHLTDDDCILDDELK